MNKRKELFINSLSTDELANGHILCPICHGDSARPVYYNLDTEANLATIKFECWTCGFKIEYEGNHEILDAFLRTNFHKPLTLSDFKEKR